MMRTIITGLPISIGVTVVALKFFPIPYCWIGLTWALAGFAIAAKAPSVLQSPLLIAASVSLAFAVGEAFITVTGTGVPRVYVSHLLTSRTSCLAGN